MVAPGAASSSASSSSSGPSAAATTKSNNKTEKDTPPPTNQVPGPEGGKEERAENPVQNGGSPPPPVLVPEISVSHQFPKVLEEEEEEEAAGPSHGGKPLPILPASPINELGGGDWDGGLLSLKLRDVELMSGSPVTKFMCPSIQTFGEFMSDVSTRLNLPADSFEVVYQCRGDTYEISKLPPNERFAFINIVDSKDKEYSLCLQRKVRNARVVRNLVAEFALNGHAVAAPLPLEEEVVGQVQEIQPAQEQAVEVEQNVAEEVNVYAAQVSVKGDDEGHEPPKKDFVGLRNKSMTCYVNSLLQALYSCPEFRNMIYNQDVEYDVRKKSVISALQKIFLQMQFSQRSVIDTDNLTYTFGWKLDQSNRQQDIEEFYRAMMDYITEELKRVGKTSYSNSLFAGIMIDYVECLSCKKRKSKLEIYNALSLPIRDCGKPLSEPTVEAAMRTFVQYDLLSDSNQYKCDDCNALVDAHKGQCVGTLPYFLCMQLRRWEYDFNFMCRRKLSDRVTFPFVLDMNEFVGDQEKLCEEYKDLIAPVDPEAIGSTRLKPFSERKVHSRPISAWRAEETFTPSAYLHQDDLDCLLENGPNIYQLVSVLVHRGGSSHEGHYFAYTYDFERNEWYLCNDSHTRMVDEFVVCEAFGGSNKNREDDGQAYMLLYRRYDTKLNVLPMMKDELPEQMLKLWSTLEREDMDLHAMELYERTIARLTIYSKPPGSWEVIRQEIPIIRRSTFKEAALQCYKAFFPNGQFRPSQVRLVKFNYERYLCEDSYEGKDNHMFMEVFKRSEFTDNRDYLLLETTTTDVPFQPYKLTDLVLKVQQADYKRGMVVNTLEIHLPQRGRNSTVADLFGMIASKFLVSVRDLVASYKQPQSTMNSLFEHTGTPIRNFGFLNGAEIMFQNGLELREVPLFLEFTRQYNGSYTFDIECETLSPPIACDLEENKMELSPSNVCAIVMDNNVELMDAEPAFQFEFEAEDNVVSRDCSDNSTSEDSSATGSDRTVIGVDVTDSPSNGDLSVKSKNNNEEYSNGVLDLDQTVPVMNGSVEAVYPSTSTGNVGQNQDYLFHIVSDVNIGNCFRRIAVRVCQKMPLNVLSKRLEELLRIDERNFIMYTVYHAVDHELTVIDSTPLQQLENFDFMKVRLGQRLRKGEIRMPVYLFDYKDYLKDPKYLADVILNSSWTGKKVRGEVARQLTGLIDFKLDSKDFRLRRKKSKCPSKIVKNSTSTLLSEIYLSGIGEMYLQPLDYVDDTPLSSHPIVIRRFHPSTLTLGPPFEALLHHDKLRSFEDVLEEMLYQATGIPIGNLEFAVAEGSYPFNVNPVVLVEKLTWLNFRTVSKTVLLTHNDECGVYVKDITEPRSIIPADVRRTYEREMNPFAYSASPIRIEHGLGINLARTPPT